MENAIAAGLSQQVALSRALSTAANNVANQTTAGFKADRPAFQEYLAVLPATSRAADPTVSLVFDPNTYVDFSQGALEPTGGDLDFAIDGEGFFAIETAFGVRYGRDGRFSINDAGELINRDGARVLGADGAPISVNPVGGPITSTPDGELQQLGARIGRIGVFTFDAPQGLSKEGSGLFDNPDGAAGEATARADARLARGFVEGSNVAPIVAVTNLIDISRAFTQAGQIISTANELAREAIERLGETS